ncbi:SRPBCC family protein [Patulibacter sp. SYSU D01012]|uniref:SRPBCC family protein n=1 Tax=Patulibacter sp. SYSU D01012 TaxID=2817381 RepID=UPI001B31631E
MDPVRESITIERPREEVFAYLADVANHREFLAGRFEDWRLTREDSIGQGAGARFHLKLPFNRFSYYDYTFTEVDAPFRIAFVGRGGKYARTMFLGEITVVQDDPHAVTVAWSMESDPGLLSDSIMETVGGMHGAVRRSLRKGLRTLRAILEDGAEGAGRVSIAGGARKPASNFRLDPRLADEAPAAGAHAVAGRLD